MDFSNQEWFKALASIVTGGAFVGWYREYRKGRKDTIGLTIDFIKMQSSRIDVLVEETVTLRSEIRLVEQELSRLRDENIRLRQKLTERYRNEVEPTTD